MNRAVDESKMVPARGAATILLYRARPSGLDVLDPARLPEMHRQVFALSRDERGEQNMPRLSRGNAGVGVGVASPAAVRRELVPCAVVHVRLELVRNITPVVARSHGVRRQVKRQGAGQRAAVDVVASTQPRALDRRSPPCISAAVTINLSFAQIGSQFESVATTTCSIYSGYATTCRKCHWLS